MDKKEDRLLDHDYDGIRELDNDLPPWWLWLFYISIIFAVVYMIHYHVAGTGDLSSVEYQKEVDPNWTEVESTDKAGFSIEYRSPFYNADAEMTPKAWAAIENYVGPNVEFESLIMEAMRKANTENLIKLKESFPEIWANLSEGGATVSTAAAEKVEEPKIAQLNYTRLTDAASLESGKQTYVTNCASCHGMEGQGGIGPNMTDNYYIHGDDINDIMNVLIKGVVAKGMISWKGILSDQKMTEVASYIMSLRGTNPPNPKTPQGELVEFPENAVN